MRRGYVGADGSSRGSGYARRFTDHEALIALVMADLVHIGFSPQAAAEYAREAVRGTADQGRKVHLVINPTLSLTIDVPYL